MFLLAGFLAGCNSVSSNSTGGVAKSDTSRLFVCHGYDCTYKTRLDLGPADARRFAAFFSGANSAQTERKAVSAAVQYYENRAAAVIGVRDQAKSTVGGSREKGQMDCIDESTNTRSLLLYLEKHGLLKHHTVEWNRSRGVFVDGRYPHSTAVISERSGRHWAVDSWYEPVGGAPDIMPLDEWMKRGVMGER